jgi:hypothetical protein
LLALAALLGGLAPASLASSGGVNAPGGCSCHSTLNFPTTSVCIEGLPPGRIYDPSTSYPIRVVVNGIVLRDDGGDPARALAGFTLRVANASATVSGGTLSPLTPADAGTVFPWAPNIMSHSGPGNLRTEWNLRWTPDPSLASVNFTLAGNAVNGDTYATGDDLPNREVFTFRAVAGAPAIAGIECSNPPIAAPIYVPDTNP